MAVSSNPIFTRLTCRSRPPSLRATLWLAFGLGLATLAFTTWKTLRMTTDALDPLCVILLVTGVLLITLTPPVTAAVAAALVARDSRAELIELLRLTPLTERRLVQGYIAGALHRTRVWLALVVGLTPAAVVGTGHVLIAITVLVYAFSGLPSNELYYYTIRPAIEAYVGQLLTSLTLACALWGMHWAAAALGAALALWPRTVAWAAVLAPMVILLFTAILLIMAALMDWQAGWVIGLLILVIPYAAGMGLTRLAERWAAV